MKSNTLKSNEIKYYMRGVTGVFAGLSTCGGILTAYYAFLGFSNQQIASFSSVGSAIQIIVYIASIFVADRMKNIKHWIAWLTLSSVLPCLALLPFSLTDEPNTAAAYYLYLAASCANSLLAGLAGSLTYRLPYLIINMKDFARLENVNSIISNCFSIGSKILLTFLTAFFFLRQLMFWGMLIGIFFSVIYTLLTLSLKIDPSYDSNSEENASAATSGKPAFSLEKLKMIQIRYFHVPNLLRGLSSAAIGLSTVVFMNEITPDTTAMSTLSTLMAVSSILAAMLYQALRKKITTVKLYLASSVAMFIGLGSCLIGKNIVIFFLFFFLAYFGYMIISTAGAVYATEIVGYYDIGTYSAVRMIALMTGTAIGSQGIAIAMDHIPTLPILAVCGMCQLISGILYYRFDVKYRKHC